MPAGNRMSQFLLCKLHGTALSMSLCWERGDLWYSIFLKTNIQDNDDNNGTYNGDNNNDWTNANWTSIHIFKSLVVLILFQSEVSILVIPNFVAESYLASGDGSSQISANINATSSNYANEARHAVVKGKLYIFGGTSDNRKVIFVGNILLFLYFRSRDWTIVC